MLSTLRIQNLAIVEELEVEFNSGFNVLTGETGAGKSIILKAIELLGGGRASADLVRAGAKACTVEGVFQVDFSTTEVAEEPEELADILSQSEILIRRVIEPSGRGKVYINDRLSTLALLQYLATRLLDITGQHQQQSLLDSRNHLRQLDEFGSPGEILEAVREAYAEYLNAKRKLETFLNDQSSRQEYFRRITFERDELSAAELKEGKRAALEGELKRLANVETLTSELNGCLELLESDENSVDSQLRRLSTLVEHLRSLDPSLGEAAALLDSANAQLQELHIQLTDYGSSLESDPERLESLREGVAELARLERKYGKPESELLKYFESISQEIAEFESGGFDEAALRKSFEIADAKVNTAAAKLSTARKQGAANLSVQVKTALRQLGMKHAEFIVEASPAPLSATGTDKIEFLLSANPGEPPRVLSAVASGGELSRILLVLKTVLSARSGARTQIFDEVDSGISGSVAQIVAEKLRQVASGAQVIIVTHSPQIAAFADTHYFISKNVVGEKTLTQLEILSESGRVKQLAAMLAGKKVSAQFEQSARELLSLRRAK